MNTVYTVIHRDEIARVASSVMRVDENSLVKIGLTVQVDGKQPSLMNSDGLMRYMVLENLFGLPRPMGKNRVWIHTS